MKYAVSSSVLFVSVAVQLWAGPVEWPGGAEAAVVLTYDDGIDSHLDVALPDLQEAGLRGTFYVSGFSSSLRSRMAEWRRLAELGHEIGNHTLFHPCLSDTGAVKRDWVTPERDLLNFTVHRMIEDIRVAR